MSQYERIVSYLYRYENGEKKENSGYAKVERRENECRIRVQTKVLKPVKSAKAYLYKQKDSGIETVEIGDMQLGRNEMRLKARTEIANLFKSGMSFEQMDGIFIDAGDPVCYATTWKQEFFNPGDWFGKEAERRNRSEPGQPTQGKRIQREQAGSNRRKEDTGEQRGLKEQNEAGSESGPLIEQNEVHSESGSSTEQNEVHRENSPLTEQNGVHGESGSSIEQNEVHGESGSSIEQNEVHGESSPLVGQNESGSAQNQAEKTAGTADGTEVDMEVQSMCGECPLKQKTGQADFGHRILMTFPTMYPFKETEKGSCVKMDLQDIGCLPMRFWPLSGNRFLLHGYYCYRHLLFIKSREGSYCLGVPGIYSEKECRNSARYGFHSFRPIGEERRQGAFGYWLMRLE